MTTQTQTKDYILCDNEKAVLLRYLEILKDKGVIEEDDYYKYKNYYDYCIDRCKYFSKINGALWEYLEILDDEGIIEDYAKEYAVEQFYNSMRIRWRCRESTVNDVIGLFCEDFENKPDEDDFDNYDDYEYAIERFNNELCDSIYELKVFLRNYLKNVIMEDVKNEATFSVVDKYTGATLYIPNTSKYFDYFEDIVYEYVYKSVEYAFDKVSKKYPFIGKF